MNDNITTSEMMQIDVVTERCCGFPSCEEEYYDLLVPKVCKNCGADCTSFLCGKRCGR